MRSHWFNPCLYGCCCCIIIALTDAEWTHAAVDDDNGDLGARLLITPAMLSPETPVPLLSIDLVADDGTVVVVAAEYYDDDNDVLSPQATAIAAAGGWLWVAMPTCLIRSRIGGRLIPRHQEEDAVAGTCVGSDGNMAGGRDGPPRLARFRSLSGLSVCVAPPVGAFFAAWDADARLVVGTPWDVRTVPPLQPPYDLPPSRQSELSLLFTVPASQMLLLVTCTDRDPAQFGRCGALLLRCDACVHSASAIGDHPQRIQPPPSCGAFLSGLVSAQGLWFLCADGSVHHAFIDDATADAFHPQNSLVPFAQGCCIGFDRLLFAPVAQQLWAISRAEERLLRLTPSTTNATDNLNHTAVSDCRVVCHPGEIRRLSACITAPAGGYSDPSVADTAYVLCPPGTHNPTPGAVHADACLPCPPFTFADRAGAALCAACPTDAPLQTPARTGCVAQCPPHTLAHTDGACLPCPIPGQAWSAADRRCAACPPTRFAALGEPCTPCAAFAASGPYGGATRCVPHPPPDEGVCYPTGDAALRYYSSSGGGAPPPYVHTTALTYLPADSRAMVAANNGSVWIATAGAGALILFQPATAALDVFLVASTLRLALAAPIRVNAAAGLALTFNEAFLFFGATDGSIRRLHSSASSYDALAPVPTVIRAAPNATQLCLAVPAPTTADALLQPRGERWQWLFWLDGAALMRGGDGGAIFADTGASTGVIVHDDPSLPIVLLCPDDPHRRAGLLVLSAAHALYHLNPLGGTLRPIASAVPQGAAWMRRWLLRGTLFGVGHALVWQSDIVGEESIILGDPALDGYADGEPGTALLGAPTAPAALAGDANAGLLLFIDAHTASLRAAFHRGCECAADFFLFDATACVPCPPPLLHSAAGAAGCSPCPSGQFRYGATGECAACPLGVWWRSTADPMLHPCPRLRGAIPPTLAPLRLYTLRQAQTLINAGYFVAAAHSVRTDAPLPALFPPRRSRLPADWLLRLDMLGAFFAFTASDARISIMHDPAGVARRIAPGLRARCATVDDPCACHTAAFALGEPGPPWNSAREAAARALQEDDGNSTRQQRQLAAFVFDESEEPSRLWPVFLLLANATDAQHETAVSIFTPPGCAAAAASAPQLYVGWPPVYHCASPVHYWSAGAQTQQQQPEQQRGCLPCPSGTFAFEDDAWGCRALSPNSTAAAQGPVECPPGFFLQIGEARRACVPCPPGTYADVPMVAACLPKTRLACDPGYYLFDNGRATAEDVCVACEVCGASQRAIHGRYFYLDDGNVTTPPAAAAALPLTCDGTTRFQPYACTSAVLESAPGFAIIFLPPASDLNAARVKDAALDETVPPPVIYAPCSPSGKPPQASVWTTGPSVPREEGCFFRCKYALDPDGLAAYIALLHAAAAAHPDADGAVERLASVAPLLLERPEQNRFPYFPPPDTQLRRYLALQQQQAATWLPADAAAAAAADGVCMPCLPAACPEGFFRLNYSAGDGDSEGCGPPCLLLPQLCGDANASTTAPRTVGCMPVCTDIPPHAHAVDDECRWRCDMGWFLGAGAAICVACAPSAAACPSGHYFVASRCTPQATVADVCAPCPLYPDVATLVVVPGGDGENTSSSASACTYACLENNRSYPNPDYFDRFGPDHSSSSNRAGGGGDDIRPCLPCTPIPNSPASDVAAAAAASSARPVCPAGQISTLAHPEESDVVYRCGDDEPLCAPCPAVRLPVDGGAVFAPTDDAVCRIQCRPGYHSVRIDTGEVVLPELTMMVMIDNTTNAAAAHDPAEITCEPCARRPQLPCPECPPGTAAPDCMQCLDSVDLQCPPGTYAPSCNGGDALQPAFCVLCPAAALLRRAEDELSPGGARQTRLFVPAGGGIAALYSENNDYNSGCLTACVPRTAPDASRRRCIACASLPIPHGAPYRFYGAAWNATPRARWWHAHFDPPHMPPRARTPMPYFLTEEEPAAGVCWPCSALVEGAGYADPCAAMHFAADLSAAFRFGAGAVTTVAVPTRFDGGYQLAYDSEPPDPLQNVLHQALVADGRLPYGRRLLLFRGGAPAACPPGTFEAAGRFRRLLRKCAPCPPNFACRGGAHPKRRCPPLHVSTGGAARCVSTLLPSHPATAAASSPCPTHHRVARWPSSPYTFCAKCPPGTAGAACRPLPVKFHGDGEECGHRAAAEPNTWPPRCVCQPGAMRDKHGRCVPCPRGTRKFHFGDAPCSPN